MRAWHLFPSETPSFSLRQRQPDTLSSALSSCLLAATPNYLRQASPDRGKYRWEIEAKISVSVSISRFLRLRPLLYTRLCAAEAARRHSPARSTCAAGCTRSALLATRRQHGVGKSRNMSADMLVPARAAGLDAADHLLCEVAVCKVRDSVTEISGGATRRHRCCEAQS